MIHIFFSNNPQCFLINPFPIYNPFIKLTIENLHLILHIKTLYNLIIPIILQPRSQSQYLLFHMHYNTTDLSNWFFLDFNIGLLFL